MNIKYAVAASLLLSLGAYAQKDELKALKKLSEKETPLSAEEKQKYASLLAAAEPALGGATAEQKSDFYFFKAKLALKDALSNPNFASDANKATATLNTAADDINKALEMEKSGKKSHTKEIQDALVPQLKGAALSVANNLSSQKKYKEAGQAFELAYKVDPTDGANLYNAAAMSVNGQDYDAALKSYLELDKIGFTGEGTSYVAKNKMGQDEYFPNKSTMDISVKQGLYTNPREEKLPSLKGDIVKNIALIYVQKGEVEKAKQAMSNARKAFPDDTSLIVEEANLYYKTNDIVTYKKLISEAVQKNPNDAVLLFNLGVVTTASDKAEAAKYYTQAIALKPDYFDAYINMGLLQIEGEKKVVDEMNKLGSSAKDNQRYEVLKKQKDVMYTKALPYLEKAHKIKPEDQYVVSILAGMYQALDKTAEYKAMKAKQKA
jgi:tetratricopeptide (TPR) repeat protein